MPSSKLTRSLSRPFTDFSNLLLRSPSSKSTTTRPELSNLTTLKKRHSLKSRKSRNKQKSSTPTPPPFTFHESFSPSPSLLDLSTPQLESDQIQFEPLSPSHSPSPSPSPSPTPTEGDQETYEHLLDSLPYAIERRLWKECSPVLEDPELEAIESSFFTAKQIHSTSSLKEKESRERWIPDTTTIEGEEEGEEEEESFVTCKEEGGFQRESPVKLRNGLFLPHLQTEEEEEEEEQEEEYRSITIPQDSPTSLTCSTQGNRSYAVDTPDTSFPSSPGHEEPCEEPTWLVASSSTPSKLNRDIQPQHRIFTPPRFVEVVETCPTPEGQNEEKEREEMESPVRRRGGGEANEQEQYRRRSLLRTSELDFDRESIEELEINEEEKEEEEEATRYLSNYSTHSTEPRSPRAHYTSPTASTLHLHRSYAPSIISEASHSPSRTSDFRNHSRNSTSSPSLFPTVSASDLVLTSLLSASQLAPTQYSSLSHRAPLVPLKQTRPLSASYSSHQPLRPKQSEISLFTYDLSHLPAPETPLEKPYRVSWRDLLKPSASLGGGRGSGRFGDLGGAVERKSKRSGLNEEGRTVTPIPGIGRRGSVRRSLSRWSQGLSSILDLDEHQEEGEVGMEEGGKVRRSQSIRRSLSRSFSTFSMIGGRRRAREEEKERRRRERERLDQWVSVVVA